MVNLVDYFQYHPPKTKARKISHDSINHLCLMACQSLFATNDTTIVDRICNELSDRLFEITQEPICLKWIKASLDKIKDTLIYCNEESTLMLIQQVRMFANQAVTLDELRFEEMQGKSLIVVLDDANLLDGKENS